MTKPRAICVYCGSSAGASEDYARAAARLGENLAAAGVRLVYGGGSIGLMGVVARAALSAGGAVTGIIPRHLDRVEVTMRGLTELHVVESMHERKRRMFELADAFVTLPGGLGTLDETIEIVTWRLLGLHDKPVVIVNHRGYWDPLLALIEHAIRAGFASAGCRDLYRVVAGVDDVLPALIAARPPRQEPEGELI